MGRPSSTALLHGLWSQLVLLSLAVHALERAVPGPAAFPAALEASGRTAGDADWLRAYV